MMPPKRTGGADDGAKGFLGASSVIQQWPGPKGAGLKSFALYLLTSWL